MKKNKGIKRILGLLVCMLLLMGITTAVWAKAPADVKISAQKSNVNGKKFTIYWKSAADAQGYDLQLYSLNKKLLLQKRVEAPATSYTLSPVKAGTFYRFRIRGYQKVTNPYTGLKRTVYGKYTTIYVGQQPKVKFSWIDKKTTRAVWTAVDGAVSYNVYLATSRGGDYKKQGTVKVNEMKLKKLKMDTNYYVYVTANYKDKKVSYSTPMTNCYPFRLQNK